MKQRLHAARLILTTSLLMLTLSACGAPTSPASQASGDGRPVFGADEPLVVVQVFSDYQCGGCRRAYPFVDAIHTLFPDTVQVRYHQMPLTGIHPLAREAAVYALAAHRQGGFKCMDTLLYARFADWVDLSAADFGDFALGLGAACRLDEARLARDAADNALGARVDAEAAFGRELGIRGTPTILVNGIEPARAAMPGTPQGTLLAPVIRRERRLAAAAIAAGTPRAEAWKERVRANIEDPRRASLLVAP